MLEKLTPSQKKSLQWIAFCLIVGVGFMLVQPSNSKRPAPQPLISEPAVSTSDEWTVSSYEEKLERELTVTLSLIDGVGNVKVFVTLERGKSIKVAETTTFEDRVTEESDQQGGTRTTHDIRETSTPVTLRIEGEKKEVPLILEEYEPLVRGVLVVAAGAQNSEIRYRIASAVQAVLQIPMYKIEVLPKVQ